MATVVVVRQESPASSAQPKRRRIASTVAAVLGAVTALGAVGASLWVGSSASETANVANQVADQTRQDTLVAQRATQFAMALDQIASIAPEVQLGGISTLGHLMDEDPNSYATRSCRILRGVVNSRIAAPRPRDAQARAARDGPIIASLNTLGASCADTEVISFVALDLSGSNLSAITLRNLRLDGVNLQGANLEGADLSNASLRDGNLTGSYLAGANFHGANLASAMLINIDARGSRFTDAVLVGAQLKDADLAESDLGGLNASGGADFFRAKLIGCNLKEANLTDANLTGANLTGAQLSGARLVRANLRQATVDPTSLSQADTWDVLR